MVLIVVGMDVGKAHDPTALVVAEYEKIQIGVSGEPVADDSGLDWFNITLGLAPEPLYDTRYIVRSVRRLPLLLPYPAVATYVQAIIDHLCTRNPGAEVYLVVDATGVGAPVVDLIRQGIRPDVHLTAVTITAGTKCPSSPLQRSEVTMAKEWMVSRIQALLQSRRLVMPQTAEAQQLAAELLDFEISVSRDAQMTSGAKQGSHDDLVTAAALACIGDVHTEVRYTAMTW
jgi:hypothetical protein